MSTIEEEAKRKVEEANERAKKRKERSTALAEWDELEKARKARNNQKRIAHQNSVKAWEAERVLARSERRKPGWTKPAAPPSSDNQG